MCGPTFFGFVLLTIFSFFPALTVSSPPNLSPKKVGPHTFTLAVKKDLPQKGPEFDACYEPGGLCAEVGKAHDVDFEAETIGKNSVESGDKGWDTLFTPKKFGDSYFLGGPGQTYKRKVTAKPGTKLTYFCFIHPFMQGSIKVK